MELNLNCDLGEKSNYYDGRNDHNLIKIINTANIACGFHAGNIQEIKKTILDSKNNSVSIGAHPSFKDKKNFGRKRINLSLKEIDILINDQLNIIDKISKKLNYPITHVKPHGALNNMACENFELAKQIGNSIKKFNDNLIYMVLPKTEMINAAKKIEIRYACEIFADRNYNEAGLLIERSDPNALITDPEKALENISEMIEKKSIKTLSGKLIKTEIDTICIHGDGYNAIEIAKKIKNGLETKGIVFKPLNKLNKFQ